MHKTNLAPQQLRWGDEQQLTYRAAKNQKSTQKGKEAANDRDNANRHVSISSLNCGAVITGLPFKNEQKCLHFAIGKTQKNMLDSHWHTQAYNYIITDLWISDTRSTVQVLFFTIV